MASSSSAVKFQVLGFPCTATSRKSNYVFFGQRLNSKFGLLLLNLSKKSCIHCNRTKWGYGDPVVGKIVGIDLGTTNSAVAAMVNGKPIIISKMPSVVAYTQNGDTLVGEIAERQASQNPENTFYSVKRFIGRNISEVEEQSKQVAYQVVGDEHENGNVKFQCPAIGKQLAPEDVSAQIMRKPVEDASKFLSDKVTKAVVTVPSYFNDIQRRATMDAGKIAGLETLYIVSEPFAASLALVFEKKKGITLIFHLGGGTFDVAVHEVGKRDRVMSISGDAHLGGDDFDKRIVDWLAESSKRDEGTDLFKDEQALQCLTDAAEKAKIELSFSTQTNISLPLISETVGSPKKLFKTTLTRAKFEELCSDLLDRLKVAVENSLRDAKLAFDNVDEVILVGRSVRIPSVQELVKNLTGIDSNVTANPEDTVALGAAVQAGILSGDVTDVDRYESYDRLTLSLGIETSGGKVVKIIPRQSRLPKYKSEMFSTIADGQTSIVIHVLQGESDFVRDNKSLGSFRINGICPAPRGVPQIEVIFEIDDDGIVSVEAYVGDTEEKLEITRQSTKVQ